MSFLKKSVIAALLTLLVLPAFGQGRIATIDLRKVFDDYYKTKAADSTLKDRANDLEKERKVMLDQYQKSIETHKKALDDANDPALSPDEREKRKKTAEGRLLDIRSLEQSINEFDKTARISLEEQQRNMRDKILAEIRNVINAKAKTGGYSMVLDSAAESANRTPVMLYNAGENDLTSEVLSQLNTAAPRVP